MHVLRLNFVSSLIIGDVTLFSAFSVFINKKFVYFSLPTLVTCHENVIKMCIQTHLS